MPIYEYSCPQCAEVFEEWQKDFLDRDMQCPHCGALAKRLISNTAFILKGSGWYVTDYANGKKNGEQAVDKAENKSNGDPAKAKGEGVQEKKNGGMSSKQDKTPPPSSEKKAMPSASESKSTSQT